MSANLQANGGLSLRALRLPDFRDYAVAVSAPGAITAESASVQRRFIRDVVKANSHTFRVFRPDETSSNPWGAVFEATDRCSIDPGFIDHVVNKLPGIIRVYLPPDANTLLSVTDHCLRSQSYVNIIVAGKQPAPQWLSMDAAIRHCTAGIGIWEWASSDRGDDPDMVMACAGEVPTLETLAAVSLLRGYYPKLRIRVVNVVDLMRLPPAAKHPHGLADTDFDALFTTDKPVLFAYHGYPGLIHRLTYLRTNHPNIHVRGYKEEGTTSPPLDRVVWNNMDRFHLAVYVIDRIPALGASAAYVKQDLVYKLIDHRRYVAAHGENMPDIRNPAWNWTDANRGPSLARRKVLAGSKVI